MQIYWLWYAERKVPEHIKIRLLKHFSDAEEIYLATPDALMQIEGMTEKYIKELKDKNLKSAEKIIEDCRKAEIGILTYDSEYYPPRLRHISNPPMVLYHKGKMLCWDTRPAIGIVGTRKATPYGLHTAVRFGRQIAACGGLVVSGGAFGIDAMAMQGALAEDRETVAVLGSGLDIVYPKANEPLFEQVAQKGCLLSEYPPQTPPNKWNFPRRNRIISGICNGVLVVEAPERSGALITAEEAKEQGRDVFAVPGNVDMESCRGSNILLQQGAIAALSGWDVVGEYETLYPQTVKRPDKRILDMRDTQEIVAQRVMIPGKTREEKVAADKKSIDKERKSPYSVSGSLPELTPEEKVVLSVLTREPQPMDEILQQLDIPMGQALSIITKLTLKGVVKQLPGKRFRID